MSENNQQTRAIRVLNEVDDLLLSALCNITAKDILDQCLPSIEEALKQRYGKLPDVIEIHDRKTETKRKVKGVVHEKFKEILQIVDLGIPVFLVSGAGMGKNVIAKQIADALGIPFYFSNAIQQEYKLTGFVTADGKFVETQFYKAFTEGGLFFFDEIDASIPEALICTNAAIANRYFDFPGKGRIEAHPNFRIIAAGNTYGTGADNEYTGRYRLDAASLDRFAIIEIGWSRAIEEEICEGNKELIDFAHVFREIVEKAGISCIFSYRSLDRINKLQYILPLGEVLKISLLKGLDVDDIQVIKGEIRNRGLENNNKYARCIIKPDLVEFSQPMKKKEEIQMERSEEIEKYLKGMYGNDWKEKDRIMREGPYKEK